VPAVEDLCTSVAPAMCAAAREHYVTSLESGGTCDAEDLGDFGEGSGLMWGLIASLIADVVISIGLGFQKVAHNRVNTLRKGLRSPDDVEGAASPPGDGSAAERPDAAINPAAARSPSEEENKGPSAQSLPVWWLGILLTVGGEIGNFAAYGDPNTPASVVTAVGCVGVIANSFIATLVLGEPLRVRDVAGGLLVVGGVILMVMYAPQQPCVLTAQRFYWLLGQPASVVLLSLLLAAVCALFVLCPRYGHRHVLWNLTQASLLGSLTVLSSKAVSTFVGLSLGALLDPSVPFLDQVDSTVDEAGCASRLPFGGHWGEVSRDGRLGCITARPPEGAIWDDSGHIIEQGSGQLGEPALYLCLLVLASTGVAQVKYINAGMALFGNTQVIPVHYVTFTFFSIMATSIFYQEFVVDEAVYLHLFLDGAALTFLGVFFITSSADTMTHLVDSLMNQTPLYQRPPLFDPPPDPPSDPPHGDGANGNGGDPGGGGSRDQDPAAGPKRRAGDTRFKPLREEDAAPRLSPGRRAIVSAPDRLDVIAPQSAVWSKPTSRWRVVRRRLLRQLGPARDGLAILNGVAGGQTATFLWKDSTPRLRA